jgi:2-hydroxychromene-2-carboxylate isomerase
LLRLAVAAAPSASDSNGGQPNRYVVESIFKHVWCSGLEATDAQRFEALQLHLLSQAHLTSKDPQSLEVKQLLQQQTQQAIDLGLFGVPSIVVDGQIFWGQDALPMLRAYLQGDVWFESADWVDAGKLPVGIRRTPAPQ